MLAVARRLFAAHGYAQTSIGAIAAEADVNQRQVTTCFGGKEALFMEAVGRVEIQPGAFDGGLTAPSGSPYPKTPAGSSSPL